jgi:hypothetical protein
VGKCALLHLDPLLVIDPYDISAPAPDLAINVNAVVLDNTVFPAMQDTALTDLPVPEDLLPAFRASYREHTGGRITLPDP